MTASTTNTLAPKTFTNDELVPRLRFPEFKEAWKKFALQSLATRITSKNKTLGHNRVLTNSAERGIIDQRDYFDKDIANTENIGGYYIVEEGAYVYNPRTSQSAPVGPISKNKLGTGIMSPLYTVFKFKNIQNGFFDCYFSTTRWHTYIRQVSSTGARHDRMSIGAADFMKLPLPVPTLPEQQKIADCLSSLDDLIGAESEKLEALKVYKKGLMQELFPREGETVPRIRFPEFEGSGEWEVKRLGEVVASIDAGVSVNSGDRPAGPSEIGVLKTSCVFEGIFNPHENKVVNNPNEIERVREPVQANTIIISRMNTPALVGANAYISKNFENLFLPDRLWAAKSNEHVFMPFLAALLASDRGKRDITALATGTSGSMKNIAKSSLLELSVSIPSLPEQQKIASVLTSLDDRITVQAERIETLKEHKKGLMQQLFPVMEG